MQGSVSFGGKATRNVRRLDNVLKKFPKITFYWAGDGPYAKKILSALEKYPNFKWLGNLDYPDKVRQFLTEIDIYALISGMDMSPPHSTRRHQLMEKPVIATNVGGIPELIKDGETGFLVEKGKSFEQITIGNVCNLTSKSSKSFAQANGHCRAKNSIDRETFVGRKLLKNW